MVNSAQQDMPLLPALQLPATDYVLSSVSRKILASRTYHSRTPLRIPHTIGEELPGPEGAESSAAETSPASAPVSAPTSAPASTLRGVAEAEECAAGEARDDAVPSASTLRGGAAAEEDGEEGGAPGDTALSTRQGVLEAEEECAEGGVRGAAAVSASALHDVADTKETDAGQVPPVPPLRGVAGTEEQNNAAEVQGAAALSASSPRGVAETEAQGAAGRAAGLSAALVTPSEEEEGAEAGAVVLAAAAVMASEQQEEDADSLELRAPRQMHMFSLMRQP